MGEEHAPLVTRDRKKDSKGQTPVALGLTSL